MRRKSANEEKKSTHNTHLYMGQKTQRNTIARPFGRDRNDQSARVVVATMQACEGEIAAPKQRAPDGRRQRFQYRRLFDERND